MQLEQGGEGRGGGGGEHGYEIIQFGIILFFTYLFIPFATAGPFEMIFGMSILERIGDSFFIFIF